MSIIPLPVEFHKQEGTFTFTSQTSIQADEANQANAVYLHDLLAPSTGFFFPSYIYTHLSSEKRKYDQDIYLTCNELDAQLGQEGYRLSVRPDGVKISANTPAGVFYGIQTLRQLLPPEIERRSLTTAMGWKIPSVEIFDTPRFGWRGFMLDEGRHFHGKAEVLRLLDLMALHKLNIFHWHLTEDQGWRIEIQQYPRLTEVGARRVGTSKAFFGKHDGVPHAGFYTQAELREVVGYAADRHILVVPEVEMPGHTLAALAAYPELSCTGGPFEVATHFGIYPEIYCAGKEAVFTFLQNVLEEVMELFPSPYLHIGGDEAPKKRWKACPDCQKRMVEENIPDAHALQGYFTNRIATFLAKHNRMVIGWDQILHPGLVENVVAQYWIGNRKKMVSVLQGRRKVINSSWLNMYLDHSYSFTSLSRAYAYEPIFPGLDESATGNLLGIEPPLWGEFVPSRGRIDYQAFPRLTAFAETGWTPRLQKNYAGFLQRLPGFFRRMDELGVKYAPLSEVEPPRWKQWLGILTMFQPQVRIAT